MSTKVKWDVFCKHVKFVRDVFCYYMQDNRPTTEAEQAACIVHVRDALQHYLIATDCLNGENEKINAQKAPHIKKIK